MLLQSLATLAVALLMVLAALPLVVPPPSSRAASWLRKRSGSVSEATVIATRAALQRIGFLSGVTIVIIAVALVISDLDFYLAMVGYAVAIIVGAAAPLGGSERRRAELVSGSEGPSSVKGASRIAVGLSALTIVLSVVVLFVLNGLAEGRQSMLTLQSHLWLADVDSRQLVVIAAASALVSALSLVGWIVVARRQSVAGAASDADRMIRALCSRRIRYGALGGQGILLGALMPAVQVFTVNVSPSGTGFSYSVNEVVVTVTSAVGLVVILAGVVACVLAVLLPVWIQPRRSVSAPEASDSSSAHTPVTPAAEAGSDADKPERG